jgi:hypothetical protein
VRENGQRFLIQEFPYEGANFGVRLTHVRRGSNAADRFACPNRLTERRADNGTRYRCGPDQHDEEVEEIDQKSRQEENKETFRKSEQLGEATPLCGERRPALAA